MTKEIIVRLVKVFFENLKEHLSKYFFRFASPYVIHKSKT